MNDISTHYRELTGSDIDTVANECATAWQDEAIPSRQYELAVKHEIEGFRAGAPCAPFDALVKCLRRLPIGFLVNKPMLLDIGASAGYYKEVLHIAGFDFRYTGVDFSPAFKKFAERIYPGIDFDCADARALPYHDGLFSIVLNAAVLMHTREYAKVISEAVRVSRRYVVFHRTPVFVDKPTTYFEKEAYGVRCLEIHFNEDELLGLFAANGLTLLHAVDVFWQGNFGHRDYLLEKEPALVHMQV